MGFLFVVTKISLKKISRNQIYLYIIKFVSLS